MGLYCEPREDKVVWIQKNGVPYLGTKFESCPKDKLPVVLLQQGFIALGVAYNKKEFTRFVQGRPDGTWFQVDKALLRESVPGATRMKEFK